MLNMALHFNVDPGFEVPMPPVAVRVNPGSEGDDHYVTGFDMKLPFMDFVVCGVLIMCVAALGMLCWSCLKLERNSARLFNAQLEAIVARMDDDNLPPVDVDQPLWYLRARGLGQSLVDAIKVVKYKKNVVELVEGHECTICLSEFDEDDSLRILPKCAHAFHVPCVDQWFMSHSNCPLCRNQITHGMITAGVPSATPKMVLELARRNHLDQGNHAALGGRPPDGMANGDVGSSVELPGSDSSESENGSNGLVENRDSYLSGNSTTTAEDDPPDNNRIDKDFQPITRSVSADPSNSNASKSNGFVAEIRIQVDCSLEVDSNFTPSVTSSKETSPERESKMAKSASFARSPSTGESDSSKNPTTPP